ncbi:unknown protein [Azorhizobium caulinodans ORS 571]|uniref:DUF2730 family protein n=1 Tax=Azorhizobium caulinodans (strain ATCC 43989 / DSM 5975 / JCM 20966 / LMG 6465 / NBRC 14845 / NCIMB 13405 / ORS 571) TaxID=438753 RepID=A8I7M6_AZOC5|nr:DUF2730 family protein [Azorhizobium caulinodans]BAF88137.1 unknown protein [Azorhizobium caulinodans ORS 571]
MEPGSMANWGSLCVSLFTLGFYVWTYRSKAAADRVAALEKALGDKASTGRLAALEDRVDKVEDRTTTIEGDIRHMPSASQAQRLEIALSEVRGDLAVLNERLGPIGAISERLQEFLLEEARSRRART